MLNGRRPGRVLLAGASVAVGLIAAYVLLVDGPMAGSDEVLLGTREGGLGSLLRIAVPVRLTGGVSVRSSRTRRRPVRATRATSRSP
jgi:hypothetical protein